MVGDADSSFAIGTPFELPIVGEMMADSLLVARLEIGLEV
jgi:hypothetical protein